MTKPVNLRQTVFTEVEQWAEQNNVPGFQEANRSEGGSEYVSRMYETLRRQFVSADDPQQRSEAARVLGLISNGEVADSIATYSGVAVDTLLPETRDALDRVFAADSSLNSDVIKEKGVSYQLMWVSQDEWAPRLRHASRDLQAARKKLSEYRGSNPTRYEKLQRTVKEQQSRVDKCGKVLEDIEIVMTELPAHYGMQEDLLIRDLSAAAAEVQPSATRRFWNGVRDSFASAFTG